LALLQVKRQASRNCFAKPVFTASFFGRELANFEQGGRMIELRLVSRHSDYLVLESVAGERFRIAIDETLRDATRYTAKSTTGTSPKDIQSMIRSGMSVADVAESTGEATEYVAMFAGAVLDELRYLLEAALSVQLPDDNQMISFRELVERDQPVTNWQIAKRESRWVVQAESASGPAEWLFSPNDLTLEPLNTAARELLKARAGRTPLVRDNSAGQSTAPLMNSAAGLRQDTAVASTNQGDSELDSPERPAASVLDLVEEIKRRDSAASASQAASPDTQESSSSSTKPASAKGRASLPSWDEIVSGTSHPDEEF
jgi:hypothetical protein